MRVITDHIFAVWYISIFLPIFGRGLSFYLILGETFFLHGALKKALVLAFMNFNIKAENKSKIAIIEAKESKGLQIYLFITGDKQNGTTFHLNCIQSHANNCSREVSFLV